MDEFIKTVLPRVEYLESAAIPTSFADAPGTWLTQWAQQLASADETVYVLIHADDGVLWGKIIDATVVTAPADPWVPTLRTKTVQQCRVFGSRGELFIWREAEDRWHGRVLIEEAANYCTIEEEQVLWGEMAKASTSSFTPLFEEGEGMHQVVPLIVTQAQVHAQHRVFLSVRHYLSEDDDGQSRIVYSRLNGLHIGRLQ